MQNSKKALKKWYKTWKNINQDYKNSKWYDRTQDIIRNKGKERVSDMKTKLERMQEEGNTTEQIRGVRGGHMH